MNDPDAPMIVVIILVFIAFIVTICTVVFSDEDIAKLKNLFKK